MKTWALMKDSEDRAMHAGRVQEAAHVQEFVEKANIEKALTEILRKDVILLEQRSVEMRPVISKRRRRSRRRRRRYERPMRRWWS